MSLYKRGDVYWYEFPMLIGGATRFGLSPSHPRWSAIACLRAHRLRHVSAVPHGQSRNRDMRPSISPLLDMGFLAGIHSGRLLASNPTVRIAFAC